MAVAARGNNDEVVDQVRMALHGYAKSHPAARIDVKRQNTVSVRARVVDPDFAGISRADRHDVIWRFLETLPEDVQSQVSLLVLLTPQETSKSLANIEFDNPIRSRL